MFHLLSSQMRLLNSDDFKSNVVKLVFGTGLAQVLPIAVLPILTRMYSPEEFGIFAIYMAVAGILGVVATGRYELSIVLPDNDKEASGIFGVSLMITLIVSTPMSMTAKSQPHSNLLWPAHHSPGMHLLSLILLVPLWYLRNTLICSRG